MSRTNPYKKKRRQASKTLLVFGEGFGEEMFLKHLKSFYHCRESGISIKIYKGRGGTPYNIIIDANRTGDYDRKIVILDNDKKKMEMANARQEAKNRNIELIENTPCLEFLLLSILEKKSIGKKSDWCKREFESKYLDRKKRREPIEYMKVFPKKLLDTQRLKISGLNKLILIMEGK